MKLLAIDLSTDACSVAVLDDGEIHQQLEPGRRPSRQVLGMAKLLLADAGLSLNDLDAIAFGHGPGAFTGLRIAAGVAQGLALGLDRPVLGISSLRALAQAAIERHDVERVAVALDARMDEIYVGEYRRDGNGLAVSIDEDRLLPPASYALPDAGIELLAGQGWAAYPELQERTGDLRCDDDLRPEAGAVARLAAAGLAAGEGGGPETAIPVYLRDKVAWQTTPSGGS